MSSNEIPDLSEMRLKISKMEKENLDLRNKIEIADSELSQRNIIVKQLNSELSDLRKQYQQALDKIVELSKKTPGKGLSPEEERIYRLQLAEQASCISSLQDRLWESENQRKFLTLHSSSSGSIDQMQNIKNHKCSRQQIDFSNRYHRSSFCDPIPNIDRAEKKIISLHHKLLDISKQNDYFYNELNNWSKFIIQIFNIASEALDEYPAFPYDDPSAQRKVVLNVIAKLAKAKSETPKLYEKYLKLKEKYHEAKEYLNTIEQKCNHLSQVTQINSINTCKFKNTCAIDLDSSSDFNDEDFAYYQKLKCSNKNATKNTSSKMNVKLQNLYQKPISCGNFQSDEYDEENIEQQASRKAYSRPKFDEKKIENYTTKSRYSNTHHKNHYACADDYDQFSNNENISFNRREYAINNQYVKKNNESVLSDNQQKIPKISQANYSKHVMKTSKSEKIINPQDTNATSSNYKQSIQTKTKINTNKRMKRQSKEANKFNNTYPQARYNTDEDTDDLYSKFGANISRLSKITENMKNDYYDFAKLTKEIDFESYSIEDLSNMNSP